MVSAGTGASQPPPPLADQRVGSRPLISSSPVTSRANGLWRLFGGSLIVVVLLAAAAASFVPLPYYRISPGSVYDTIERISVLDQSVYVPEGDIGFVTVSQTANISAWQWLDARLDDTLEIKHEDEVIGDQTPDEKREADRRRMQLSKDAAVVVALERLGHELIVTPLGVEVAAVFDCSGADGVLGTGDLILAVDGTEVFDTTGLVAELGEREVGATAELLVGRLDPENAALTSETELVSVVLGSAAAPCLADDVRSDEERPFIGIGTSNYFTEDLPFEVGIETGRVGGPSAGLAFTLAILDVLTDGELTGGLNVVATGTIDRGGNVGAVGGVRHKTVAAERSGADLFLVPLCCDNWVDPETGEPIDLPSNYEEAVEHRDDMHVVGVATLDDALRAIGEAGGDVERFFEIGPEPDS